MWKNGHFSKNNRNFQEIFILALENDARNVHTKFHRATTKRKTKKSVELQHWVGVQDKNISKSKMLEKGHFSKKNQIFQKIFILAFEDHERNAHTKFHGATIKIKTKKVGGTVAIGRGTGPKIF